LPLHVKARLGNGAAEKKLIEKYSKVKDYRDKVSCLRQFMYAGTEKTIRHVVQNFNEPIFNLTTSGCVAKSIRLDILSALRVYYPLEELIGKMLGEVEISRDSEILKAYLDEVESWLKRTFKVDYLHERPGLKLAGICKI